MNTNSIKMCIDCTNKQSDPKLPNGMYYCPYVQGVLPNGIYITTQILQNVSEKAFLKRFNLFKTTCINSMHCLKNGQSPICSILALI